METSPVDPHQLINDISISIMAAWVLAFTAKLLRQPLILAYLAAGVIIGPVGFGWIADQESIATISELGLIFLLFMIGLEIDLKKIVSAGRAIAVTSLVQIGGGCLLGVLIFKLLGFSLGGGHLDALYLAVAAALSSTVIIVKILYDKRELDTLAGRITLGVLVLQDLFAILFLAIQPDLKNPAIGAMLMSLFKVAVLVAAALVASRYVLPAVFRAVARLPELVLVGALAWCFMVCELALALGLSREMGALIAGVAISTFPYTLDVTAKVTTLRDFFLTLFFVTLGMTIPTPDWSVVGWSLVFAAFVMGSRLVTVFFPLHMMRMGHRASLLPAVNLCQVSEFSLVVIALGAKSEQISPLTQGIVLYAFVLLAVDSSYTILKNDMILRWVSPVLAMMGFADLNQKEEGGAGSGHGHRKIYLLGFFRGASSLLEEMEARNPEMLKDVAVIDYNPQVHHQLKKRGIQVFYGDISQVDTLAHEGVGEAEMILCTIPTSLLKGTSNARLVRQLRDLNPHAKILCPAEQISEIGDLYAAGASFVVVPRWLEGQGFCDAMLAVAAGRVDELRHAQEQQLARSKEIVA